MNDESALTYTPGLTAAAAYGVSTFTGGRVLLPIKSSTTSGPADALRGINSIFAYIDAIGGTADADPAPTLKVTIGGGYGPRRYP